MFGIPRRFSHFIFAVIQAGLTCLIAAGIASLPLVTIRQFFAHWAVLLGHLVGSNAPGRRACGSHSSICFSSSDERRIATFAGQGPSSK